jgi:hypothetical protein
MDVKIEALTVVVDDNPSLAVFHFAGAQPHAAARWRLDVETSSPRRAVTGLRSTNGSTVPAVCECEPVREQSFPIRSSS